MEVVFLLIGLLAGILAGFFIAKSKYSSSTGVDASELDSLRTENSKLATDKAKAEERSLLNEKNLSETKAELETARSIKEKFASDLAAMQAVNSSLEKKLDEQKKELEEVQQKFAAEFENLANKILDEKSRKFTEQNEKNIGNLLSPLREQIKVFENRVNEVYDNENKGRAALSEQLKNLQELNRQMSEEATNLTRALKGDRKQQGNWGEFILESILEKSGLERGREFSIQESLKSIDGSTLRPDVIINLPENKSLIIDSKVSLNAYEAFSSADDDQTREKALTEHISSIRRHIKGLSPKEYQNLYGLQSLDFVLMFIPIEPAFALAVQGDPGIFNEAFDRNIVVVSPSTLLATLRTIASIWKQEKQNKNALEIARQSGALYDKFTGFVEDLIAIGKRIDSSKESYQDAMKKLTEGRGNIVRQIESIKQLGARTSKTIDQRILDRTSDDDSEGLELIKPD